MLVPIQRIAARYELDRGESDVAAFHTLMYSAELLTKLLISGLLAGLQEDRDRHRYAHARNLVRADGIGEWATILDSILSGPSSHHFSEDFKSIHREFSQRMSAGAWQFDAVRLIHESIVGLGLSVDPLPKQVAARQWFHLFAFLRNKTRGHGAPTGQQCASLAKLLEESTLLIRDNASVFKLQWAFLHRNLSGKYRVVPISDDVSAFEYLKRGATESFQDGVYIYANTPRRVDFLITDVDLSDFYVPNGQFRNADFEALSYITNATRRIDGASFLVPSIQLPQSETQGGELLDVHGNAFGNLPPVPDGYVSRPRLEDSLASALKRERHEIITLSGPGGIGKTSTAIAVLHGLAAAERPRFVSIVWFSARDIDLMPSGPKPVRPHGLSVEDFAREFVRLFEPSGYGTKGFNPTQYLAKQMESADIGPTLFVFDNFETVVNPADLFRWLDTYIRPPNKVLITTRTRDFVGDLPIEVPGMSDQEAATLVQRVSASIGVGGLITPDYMKLLQQESGGHPYVIKILLGEVAKQGRAVKPERIIAAQDQILSALFERTFVALSSAAQRVFMLLSSWRSVVPAVGVEAISLRSAEERFDVRSAIDELRRLSLIEEHKSPDGNETFLSVPLAAMAFARRKLNASSLKATIDADTRLLQAFGAARRADVQGGVAPRIRRLVGELSSRIGNGSESAASYLPMLEFLGARVPACWWDIADFFHEEGGRENLEIAARSLRRYLESGDDALDRQDVWRRLARLMATLGDEGGQVHALVEMANCDTADLQTVSSAANEVNGVFFAARSAGRQVLETDERRGILSQLVHAFERHASAMTATDMSRLAWTYLGLGNEARAVELARKGLDLEPDNDYCQRLARKLNV